MRTWAREPLFIFTAGYTGGLFCAGLLFEAPAAFPLLAAALILGFAAILRGAWQTLGLQKPPPLWVAALLAAGAIASAAVPAFYRAAIPSHHLLARIPYSRVNLIGRLSAPVEIREGLSYKRARIEIAVERLFIRGVEVPVKGKVRLTLAGLPRQPFHPGDRVLVRRARLRPPQRNKNPGGFDYREFLRLRGIHATGYISPRALELLDRPAGFSWRRALFKVRDRMRDFLRETLPGPAARLLEAMVLGTRERIPPELRDSFQRAGAMHLLAISGLHVGFISAFFFFLLRAILRRLSPRLFPTHPIVVTPGKAAAILTIPIVILFALMTGARVSTIRAAIMVVAYLGGRIMERPSGPIHTLTLAAFILLLAEPGFLWDAGFQLSFLAVGAILLVAPRLPAPPPGARIWHLAWWRVRFTQLVILQAVILLALLPLTIWHFHQIQPAGLVSNLLLIPIASLAVPWTFVTSGAAAALSIFTESANQMLALFALPLRLMAEAMLRTAESAGAIPGGVITVPPGSPALFAGYLLLLALAIGARNKLQRRIGWAGAAVFLLPILWAAVPSADTPTGRLTLTLPDAGRVDAFFLRLPGGRGFAFEGNHTRGRFDTWKRVLAPLLRREGERNWDTLITLVPRGKKSRAAAALAFGFRLRAVRTYPPSWSKKTRHKNTKRPVWQVSAPGGVRLILRRWGKRALGLEVRHPEGRWWLSVGDNRNVSPAGLPRGRFDLVRLPERWLRDVRTLKWLARMKPKLVVAAPGPVKWLPLKKWRQVRARQRALGVYRTARGGMARIVIGGRSKRWEASRYTRRTPWPGTRPGRWRALLPTASPALRRAGRGNPLPPEAR